MKTRVKLILGLALLLGAALVAARVAADRPRPLGTRGRLRLLEKHFAEVATSGDTLDAQLRALAAHVAALEARLEQCGCPPPPTCVPCQEQGLCTADGAACGADADGDGTDDCLDHCPCEPGPPENGGCPPPPCAPCACTVAGATCGHDADGDGVDDCLDRCPCEPGSPDNAGCPPPPPPPCDACVCLVQGGTCGHDADGDGIDDCSDRCPCDPGPPENGGCPRPICDPCASCQVVPCGHDADGDGVDDCEDGCPCRPGPVENHGCPTGTPCHADADCDDGNPCSLDVCIGGFCEHKCLCLAAGGFACGPGPLQN